MRNLVVTFDTNLYSKKSKESKKGFQFPKILAKAFGYRPGKKLTLDLAITRLSKLSGKPVFEDRARLTSGAEVTTPKIFHDLEFGEEIRVIASNPR
jgi:hypothetical protein